MRTAAEAVKRRRCGEEEDEANGGRAPSTKIKRNEGGGGVRTAAGTIESRRGGGEAEGAHGGQAPSTKIK